MTLSLPRLYSFRRCPYAMRARLGIVFAELQVELREIVLKNKPAQMLAISPKGTVPVLELAEGDSATRRVIEESREILEWALQENDPHGLLNTDLTVTITNLNTGSIATNTPIVIQSSPSLNTGSRARCFYRC